MAWQFREGRMNVSGEGVNAGALGLSDVFLKPLYHKIARQLEQQRVEGNAGNGAVRVVLSGKQSVIRISITPGVVYDVAALERLVAGAVEDALKKSHELIKREVKKQLGSSIPLPDDLF